MSEVKQCPWPNSAGYLEPCHSDCALRIGEDCAFALLGRWAQAQLAEIERQEILASRARREA